MIWRSPVVPWEQCSEARKADLYALWSFGDLGHILDPIQAQAHDEIVERNAALSMPTERVHVLDWSRRNGKDSTMSVLAIETAIKRPGIRIVYGAPTQKMVTEILEPIFARNFADCPEDLRPDWYATKCEWRWANGSRIVLVGFDLHADRARGTSMGGCFLTEAAFIDDLERTWSSVLVPQMLTEPDAFAVLGSTPSDTPASYWSTDVCPRARKRGTYSRRTIEDNPRIDARTREAFIEEAGGRQNSKCRREYFAEHVIEETLAIVPEFHRVKGEQGEDGIYRGGIITDAYKRPEHFDAYTVIDPGMVDLFAGLFAIWDFANDRLIVEDDFAVPLANTKTIAELVREKERELWSGCQFWDAGRLHFQPYRRVSDTDIRLIADLRELHQLDFVPTAKDNRDAAINALRLRIQAGKILIHPRCANLIAHLDQGIWNKRRTDFERSGAFGHFDCVAALVYLDRNVNRGRNPVPPVTTKVGPNTAVDPYVREQERSRYHAGLSGMFQATKKKPERPGGAWGR